jgi:hypothetical protein
MRSSIDSLGLEPTATPFARLPARLAGQVSQLR